MNLPLFISRKIVKANPGSFSSIVNKIAIISIGMGLAIMLITFLVLGGFESTIREKIYSFSGHVNIVKYSSSNTFEEVPMLDEINNRNLLKQVKNVLYIQKFAHKAGLIKTKGEVQGVLLKGVGEDFSLEDFKPNMVEGSFISFNKKKSSNDVIISKLLAVRLDLKLGDNLLMYFIQNPVRIRKFHIAGIFETSMQEFDKQVIIGDISVIRKLNNWNESEVGGYEVFLNNVKDIDYIIETMADQLSSEYYLQKVSDKYIQVFDWLTLLNKNVQIFLVLLLVVACVNMGTVLLILILERTPMIGILKALGSTNHQIRKIFYYNGFLLIIKGLVLGNVLGLGLGFVQYYFKVIPLDPQNYNMKFVPILWDWPILVFLNGLILIVVSLALTIPSFFIVRINPVKAIKFD